MIKNYFKIALRNIFRHKLISGINILGLSTGITCCILIALYVFHETSYDRFHKNIDRIVRATMEMHYDGNTTSVAVTGTKVLPEFKRVFPEVEDGVRLYPVGAVLKYGNNLFQEKGFVFSDSAFFKIFSFRLLKGNPGQVLSKPNQLVLTRSIARKYFGDEDPIGKLIHVKSEKDYLINAADYFVAGIVEDCPANSQVRFEILASWSSLTNPMYQRESMSDASYYTYLLLKQPEMYKTLERKIPEYYQSQNKEHGVVGKNYWNIRVQPMTDVHLDAIVEGGMEPGGDYKYIYIFSVVAILILAIACANYVNLTVARASDRAKEVGVRKVIGASRKQLFIQFMGESLIMIAVALLISFLLVKLALPLFNAVANKELEIAFLLTPSLILTLAMILLSIGFVGRAYPSVILSGFKPVKTLKGDIKTGSSGIRLRQSLIVLQFFISTGLILATLVIYKQLQFIQNKKLGYDKDHVVVVQGNKSLMERLTKVKSELYANPSILGVTTCNQTPAFVPGKYNLVNDGKEMVIGGIRVDKDFIRTIGVKLVSGSDFTPAEETAAFAGTDTIQRPAILNESAVRTFGWTPEEAIGKTISFQGRNTMIKGVVRDFHFTSMHQAIDPFVIFLSSNTSKILVKLSGQQLSQALNFLETKWKTVAPGYPFSYEFLDDQFDRLYSAETRTGTISYSFTLLAIGLACLGLFGLVTFSVQQRTKEIGIRKVLGASVTSIVLLLSKDFLKLVGIAVIIALPVAWWMISGWLQDFAYRIEISWLMFVVAGAVVAIIAWLPISLQAIRAAKSNPEKNLRSE